MDTIQLTQNQFKKLIIALAVYLVSLFAANTLGAKLMPFLFDTQLSVGIFMFPFVFLMTDVIGEVYGKKIAKYFVLAGFIATGIFILYSFLSLAMPWGHRLPVPMESYNDVFGLSLRFAIASVVAFVVAEYQDVISFFFFKRLFGKLGFWFRSTLSNIWSQFLDTALFMAIAYVGILPWEVIVGIAIPWWLYKVAMGFFYTPLSYAGIWLLKEETAEKSAS
jgi:queuosine precursor transporter